MNLFNNISKWFIKNESELMLAMGITGVVTSTILACKATSVCKDILDKKKIEENNVNLKKKDVLKVTWKHYVPSTVTFGLSIACFMASYKVNTRRNAVIASALATSQTAFSEYQKHVIDTVGEETEKSIRNKIAEKKIDTMAPPIKDDQSVVWIGEGRYHCVESTTNQKFISDNETIRKIVNDLNQERLASFNGVVCLNDLYYALGLEATTAGNYLVWDIESPVEVDISATMVNGVPCLYVQPIGYKAMT